MEKNAPTASSEVTASKGTLLKTLGFLALAGAGFYFGHQKAAEPTTAVNIPKPAPPTANQGTESASGTARQLMMLRPGLERHQRLLSLIDLTPLDEYPQLMQELKSSNIDREALSLAWTERDAPGFFAWLKNQYLPGSDASAFSTDPLFSKWGAKDPQAALQAAKSVAHLPAFRMAKWTTFLGAYGQNSQSALPMLKDLGPTPPGFSFPDSLWRAAPGGLVKDLAAAGGGIDRWMGTALAEPLTKWAESKPDEVLAWLTNQPQEVYEHLLATALPHLAAKDPEKLKSLVATLPSSEQKEKAVAALAKGWALSNPAQALFYAAKEGGTKRRASLEDTVLTLIHAQKLPDLEAAINAIPAGPEKDAVMRATARQYLDNAPSSAGAWIRKLPADPARDNLIKNVADRWAETDPASALEFFKSVPRGQATLDAAMERFTYRLAVYDPQSATELALAQPENHRSPYVRSVFAALARESQVDDAAVALSLLPTNKDRDEALASLLSVYATGVGNVQSLTEWPEPGPELRDYFIKFIQTSPNIPADEREGALATFAEQLAAEKVKQNATP